MAKRSKRRAKRSGGTGGGALGGLMGRDTLAAIGGASAAAFVGPMIARYLPANLGNSAAGRIGGSVLIGAVGYFALKRVSRTAALAFVGASVAPAIAGELGRGLTPGLKGYGEADGVDYLPPPGVAGYLPGEEDALSGDDDGGELIGSADATEEDLAGLGEFDAEFVED